MSFTALDSYGNTATSYGGPVTLSSTDTQAVFGSASVSLGIGSASVTLETVGTQSIKVKDSTTLSISGTSNLVTVTAGAASKLLVSASPTNLSAGQATSEKITAEDAYGNIVPGFSDTLTLSSSLAAPPSAA